MCGNIGSGGSGGKNGIGESVRSNSKFNATDIIDVTNLTKEQIDKINLKRSDIWRGAERYAKETQPINEPKLTKTQQKVWDDVNDNDYSSLKNASPKTLTAILQQAEYEYDQTNRQLAKNDYDVRKDFTTNMYGQRRETGTFTKLYRARQEKARQRSEIQLELDKKRKPQREITSGTYKRAMARTTKDVENFIGRRK